ncbi:MAG TPA: hypothetical protein PLG57_04745 [Bacteroidia bacterium]|jgi:surfactin synthase thioesterase subunit|nr:hypothetical protein [Bacteroidia bacterium]HQF28147.1 hypothetical protein [Bacteroidia bacterium]HQK96403.1 hypothetical protein [Bacteroidia bacterium]
MKKLMALVILFAGMSISGFSQQAPMKSTMKEHSCTTACKEGKHMYMHGEKGHVCTKECHKAMAKTMKMKEHECNASCKDGKHMYMHGEKGHVCTDACKMK